MKALSLLLVIFLPSLVWAKDSQLSLHLGSAPTEIELNQLSSSSRFNSIGLSYTRMISNLVFAGISGNKFTNSGSLEFSNVKLLLGVKKSLTLSEVYIQGGYGVGFLEENYTSTHIFDNQGQVWSLDLGTMKSLGFLDYRPLSEASIGLSYGLFSQTHGNGSTRTQLSSWGHLKLDFFYNF